MHLPYAKPANYSTLSLEEKAKFIKQYCDARQSLWQKLHVNFFGRKHSTYIETVKAIGRYMEGYLKNDLDDCFKIGIEQYADYCVPHTHAIPSLKTCKENPLKEGDIEVAYDVINQSFLTNNEFYWFAERRLDRDLFDFNAQSQSAAFKAYLSGTLVTERRKWEDLFPNVKLSDQLPSEKIRRAIKATLIFSSGAAFAAGGLGLGSIAFVLAATSLYGISGELSDDIANLYSVKPQEIEPVNKFRKIT